ncbi:MAG: CvpA family protein [Acidiferrobacteraceae bacterium]
MTLNPLDLALVLIMALFAGLGALRGFVSELFSLASWTLAIFAGWALSPLVIPFLAHAIHNPAFRRVVAFIVVFVVVFVAVAILGFIVRRVPLKGGVKAADHVLGSLVGVARGIVILIGVVMLAQLTSLPKAAWWRSSHLAPYLQRTAGVVARHLPILVARALGYR